MGSAQGLCGFCVISVLSLCRFCVGSVWLLCGFCSGSVWTHFVSVYYFDNDCLFVLFDIMYCLSNHELLQMQFKDISRYRT